MKLSKRAWGLGVTLLLSVVVAVLLTPLGFESRLPSALTSLGFVAIGTVFLGIVLDLAALVFLFMKRTRRASALATAGSLLFVFPNVVDRAGSFFTLPIPPVVDALEYVFTAVLLVTLVMAWLVRAEGARLQR
jgi:hypothetical protein